MTWAIALPPGAKGTMVEKIMVLKNELKDCGCKHYKKIQKFGGLKDTIATLRNFGQAVISAQGCAELGIKLRDKTHWSHHEAEEWPKKHTIVNEDQLEDTLEILQQIVDFYETTGGEDI
eukprot:m.18011 g.18011  ORF g.18011 m.18011 type:complete len:119 (+) comp9487_c0_seq1:74-430(+)